MFGLFKKKPKKTITTIVSTPIMSCFIGCPRCKRTKMPNRPHATCQNCGYIKAR